MSSGPVSVPAGYRVGRWEVGEPIGAGAWGSVYAACSADAPEAAVALKFLPTAMLSPGQRALLGDMVEREAGFGVRADHPHLIRIRDVLNLSDEENPHLDGAVVLVMDRAEGNLRDVLADAPTGVPLAGHTKLLGDVCSALVYMHARGWVHGDLKPSNVLVMRDRAVRVGDFGVTAQVEGTHAYAPRIGSSDYLPPEWWTERVGESGVAQRTTADVWAFGVLAHQVLTGGLHPFVGGSQQSRATAAQAYANGSAPLRLDHRLPDAWRRLITDCLAPDHASRSPFSAASLLARIHAMPESGKSARGRALRTAAVTVLAVALAAGVAGSAIPAAHEEPAPGALRADAPVPAQYRDMITNAAHICAAPQVTPALIAAILKAESDFDPAFTDRATASYGIAGWTPSVFRSWVGKPSDDYMNPVDATNAVGRYLCWLQEGFSAAAVPGDSNELLAAGYDTSRKSVIDDRGMPPETRAFAVSVARYAETYAD